MSPTGLAYRVGHFAHDRHTIATLLETSVERNIPRSCCLGGRRVPNATRVRDAGPARKPVGGESMDGPASPAAD